MACATGRAEPLVGEQPQVQAQERGPHLLGVDHPGLFLQPVEQPAEVAGIGAAGVCGLAWRTSPRCSRKASNSSTSALPMSAF